MRHDEPGPGGLSGSSNANDGEEAALHEEGSGAPVDASRDRTQPASHSDAPQQSAHHTGAGAHVARTESMAAGGSSVVHEDDGTGVIQLTGDREPPATTGRQQQDTGENGGPADGLSERERKRRQGKLAKKRKAKADAGRRTRRAIEDLDQELGDQDSQR